MSTRGTHIQYMAVTHEVTKTPTSETPRAYLLNALQPPIRLQ